MAARAWRRAWPLLLLGLAACAPPPALEPYCLPSLEALWVLEDLARGAAGSTYQQRTPAPRVTAVSYPSGTQSVAADLYESPLGSEAGILMVPGVAQAGKDDPRLVGMARTLARARFAVLVPELSGVRDLRAGSDDVREVVEAFVFLTSKSQWAPAGRAGIVGHSYALGPALLAAMQPALRERVRFLMGVGGYYDLRRVITFFTTGYFVAPDGRWQRLEPNAYGQWVFVLSNADRLAEAHDRETLREMARRRMADPAAPIAPLAAKLGPEGRTLYGLLINRDPARTPELIQALPAALRSELDALNPALRPLGDLRARLLLVHGYEDRIIPYSESAALDRALPPHQARLFLVHGLQHVDMQAMPLTDRWRLICAVHALLAERQHGPAR